MNNDYLWDRTGSDAEIERFESLLKGMKFQPEQPPVREIVIEPVRPRWYIRLGLGFAAASMATAALMFAMLPNSEMPQGFVVAEEQETITPERAAQPVTQPDTEYIKASAPKRPKKRIPRKRPRREARIAPVPEPQRPLPETLTAEERDAYRQLMTALAITGEKLSIVRDKLNGTAQD